MKKLCFLGGIMLAAWAAMSQTAQDSLAIREIRWQRTKLHKQVVWKWTHLKNKELFGSNQHIHLAEIKLRKRGLRWAIASADSMGKTNKTIGVLAKTSDIAQRENALVAINGGFFDMKKGGSVDFIRIDGVVLDTTRHAKRNFLSNGAVTIQNRHLSIVKGDGRTDWERDLEAPNVLMSSPMLRYQNKDEVLAKSAFNDNRHPRSCLCLTNDQRLLLVVVDGRSSSAFGMSLAELNFLTKQLNCHTTLNLDGGGSTTLYVRGQPFNGVVNCPTDNKIFDHEGERLVSNIFYVK